MNKLIFFFLLIIFHFSFAQYDTPKSRQFISRGYRCLKDTNNELKLKEGKKYFLKAKRRFFRKKNIVNDARKGLSNYYLIKKDTSKVIKELKKILGIKICKCIDENNFTKFSENQFYNNWTVYYSSVALIQIYLDQNKIELANNYFTFIQDYVIVTWTCGNGAWGHNNTLLKFKTKLNRN